MLSLSQALLFSSDQVDLDRAKDILNYLMHQPKVDLRVYSLLAFNAYNDGNYGKAIEFLEEVASTDWSR